MYIGNVTFVIHPHHEDEFIGWMRGNALAALFNEESAAREPRLQTVVEAGGEPVPAEHGKSIALQAEFADKEGFDAWTATQLPPVLSDFQEKFGPQAAYFLTLLEVLPL
ncbi:MAG: DUF4286 family protein [Muribaculaceae bacterium]|nr:DUF4286 family protein [Muribaculaceae bacterium]